MPIGMNIKGRVWRMVNQPSADDDVGGAVITGTIVYPCLDIRFTPRPSNLMLLEQGLETRKFVKVMLWPQSMLIYERDELEVTGPTNHSEYGHRFRIVELFGGKGRFVNFFETGDDLFAVMSGLERRGFQSLFVMDENFLLHRKRALRLLELMRRHGKAWSLNVFSSANTLRLYSIEELVGLGISWLWIGLEGKHSAYAKLNGSDTRGLVRSLQAHGIRVLGSSIIGLAEHGPDNIDQAIEHAVEHDTELHQFMLYTPLPGTPLYAELAATGTLGFLGHLFCDCERGFTDDHSGQLLNCPLCHGLPPASSPGLGQTRSLYQGTYLEGRVNRNFSVHGVPDPDLGIGLHFRLAKRIPHRPQRDSGPPAFHPDPAADAGLASDPRGAPGFYGPLPPDRRRPGSTASF